MAQLAKKEPLTEHPEVSAAASDFTVNPKKMKKNADGFAWREFFIRLDEGVTADVLKDPGIWRRAQGSRDMSLRRHDRLYIVAHDDTWASEAIVVDSDNERAILSRPKIIDMVAGRYDGLFHDDMYKVQWNGLGFVVIRKSDNVEIGPPFPNQALAISHLHRQYAKVVTA